MESSKHRKRELRSDPAPDGEAETSFTELSCKVCSTSLQEPRPMSCCSEHVCQSCAPGNQPCPLCNEQGAASIREKKLDDSWEWVDFPAEVELPAKVNETRKTRKRSSPPAVEPVAKRPRSAKKTVYPSFSIRKVLIKEKVKGPRFYTSSGYLMEIQFGYKSLKGHQNDVCVYIYVQPGKNDKDLSWPLRGKVQISPLDLGGDTCHESEIRGTWEGPGTFCKGKLDIPYEELQEDSYGMLQFCVRVIPD